VRALVRDLNRVYRSMPALHRLDHDSSGFQWLSWQDDAHSVLCYLRKNGDEHAVVVLNFTPVPRFGYRVGVPQQGRYREILSSDSRHYGGSDLGNDVAATEPVPCMDQPFSIVVTLPPLGGIVLVPA
jgi:1,4-alpha-glucan branching enzyme